jgi:hypothetical protein
VSVICSGKIFIYLHIPHHPWSLDDFKLLFMIEFLYESPYVRVMEMFVEGVLCSSPSLEDIGPEKDEIGW